MQRKAVFRHGSSANLDANFTQAQTWVNSKPRSWRPSDSASRLQESPSQPAAPPWPHDDPIDNQIENPSPSREPVLDHQDVAVTVESSHPSIREYAPPPAETTPQGRSPYNSAIISLSSPSSWVSCYDPHLPRHVGHEPQRNIGASGSRPSFGSEAQASGALDLSDPHPTASSSFTPHLPATAFGGVQESCLLRYFIEDLSPWVRNTKVTKV